MTFTGDIGTISLAGILQLLSQEGKSGTLTVTEGELQFQTFFLEGAIVYAIESQKPSRLGQLLVNDGLVTEGQLTDCLVISKEKKQAIGKTLIEKGFLSVESLERYLYNQVQEIIFSMFCLQSGQFHFRETNLDTRWIVPVKMNTLQLVMDALRRIDDNH
ncbi:MAG: DUF4388 domain-containing protein [Thermodesulfobacteriota bacterium]